MKTKTELLAPASNAASVTAAVNSGCDAIYIGGRTFNARAYADSPDDEGLKEITDMCHKRGVKVFITLNTLYKNSELPQLLETAKNYYEMGADAFIVQDMGFFLLCKRLFPDIEVHCSTQMTIHSTSAAVYFDKMGADRVVLSRELSLEEVKDVTSHISCDTECFVHGALCVSYSGRCLMSSIFGGRSGNRGRCAQPCRMEYTLLKNKNAIKNGYLLSPKDISTADITKKLVDAGIYSFKIEGRMKSPEYVAQVVSSYRRALDGEALTQSDIMDLTQVFNRGGSSTHGYYDCFAGNNMLSPSPKSSGVRAGTVISADKRGCVIKFDIPMHCGDGIEIWNKKRDNSGCGISSELKKGDTLKVDIYGEKGSPVYRSFDKELNDRLKKASIRPVKRMRIKAEAKILQDTPMQLVLKLDENISVNGDIPSIAENKPMTKENIISQLTKTGDTPFEFDFEQADIADGLFIPVSSLKQLKRKAVEAAENYIINKSRRKAADISLEIPKNTLTRPQKLTVFAETAEQLGAALLYKPSRIYVELNKDTLNDILGCLKTAHQNGTQIYAALPRIERNYYKKEISELVETLENSELDGYLLRNYPPVETQKKLMYDYCFNVFNGVSADFFKNVTLSPELSIKELKQISGDGREIVIYGNLVLMSTHQCPVGNGTGSKSGKFCSERANKDTYCLKDRTGSSLPVMTHCRSCTAFILNGAPLFLAHRFKEIASVNAEFMRLDLTTETAEQSKNILDLYTRAFSGEDVPAPDMPHTGGHYFRGVQ